MKYYAFWGKNGASVYTYWPRLCESRKYVHQNNCKAFDNRKDASDYAMKKFHELNPDAVYEAELKLNFVTYKRDMAKFVRGVTYE